MKSTFPALLTAALLLGLVLPAGAGAGPAHGRSAGVMVPARFGGGGRGFGGGRSSGRGFGSSRRGFGGRRHGVLRRIVHALAIAYLFHLLFGTHGGLIFLFVMLALFVVLRGRRRRRSYRF
ncbi:MAG: hypothetical protein QOJ07_3894 [Thermoleophilaceae bacterium]|jgi:hypothetical protein|nr:hypothetical protein [Thermoleophilaceae bacterium]